MERFEYRMAVSDFEQVVGYAPDWLPGRMNLGIALLNATNVEQHLERATEMFEAILKEEPNNPYAHHCLGIILAHQGQATPAAERAVRAPRVH